ncbi:MAG: hypothetical protein E7034_00515 [Akkermansiaceae bacterium]|nr:hypothetical protein [Akkermansiaceae bacterium]
MKKNTDEEMISIPRSVWDQLLKEREAEQRVVTNRMLRVLCHWSIVTQVIILVTAIGTAIGGMFKDTFPWPGTLTGLIVGWPIAQYYVYRLKKK